MLRGGKSKDSFWRNRKGGVAIIIAILTPVILVIVGSAMDMQRYYNYQDKLRTATDAAILAATRKFGLTENERQEIAEQFFYANVTNLQGAAITDVVLLMNENCTGENENTVSAVTTCLTSTGVMDTTLMSLIGVDTLNLSATSRAVIDARSMEIAFAFDATSSMNFGTRWNDATTALSNMLTTLKTAADAGNGDTFRVSLIPFTDRVTIPTLRASAILDPNIPIQTSGNSNGNNKNRKAYIGCIEAREESGTITQMDGTEISSPFILSDAAPGPGAWFTPSQEGYFGPIYNSYTQAPLCLAQKLTPVTSDIDSVKQVLDGLTPRGTGRFDVGLAWAWRVLSPNWRGVFDPDWPRDYVDPNTLNENVKVAVIISDGNTVAYESEVQWDVYNGAFPNPAYKPWGHNNGTPEGFEHFTDLCNRMTDAGIHVHMVFVAKSGVNTNFLPYAQACASREGYYHFVDDADSLIEAFNRIGSLSSSLRLIE